MSDLFPQTDEQMKRLRPFFPQELATHRHPLRSLRANASIEPTTLLMPLELVRITSRQLRRSSMRTVGVRSQHDHWQHIDMVFLASRPAPCCVASHRCLR